MFNNIGINVPYEEKAYGYALNIGIALNLGYVDCRCPKVEASLQLFIF